MCRGGVGRMYQSEDGTIPVSGFQLAVSPRSVAVVAPVLPRNDLQVLDSTSKKGKKATLNSTSPSL